MGGLIRSGSPTWRSADVGRRQFLRYGGTVIGAAASGGLLAACSKSEKPAASGGGGSKPLKVRIAYTASAFPSIVNNRFGPMNYGSKFGLQIDKSDLQQFQDHATATQAVLSGQADVVSGSFLSDLLLIQKGQPFKALFSVSNGNDLLLLGSGRIDTIDKVTSPDAIVATDTPGGLVNLVANALLLAHGIHVNIESLPHTKVFGDSPPRTQSFINGQTNVAIVHSTDMPKIQKGLGAGNVHTLATLWKDVHGLIFEVMAAPTKWIDQNMETATALTKAVLTGNRELAKDYSLYRQAIDEFIPGSGLGDVDLKPIWDLAGKYEFWPYNGDLEDASISFTEQVGNQSGVFKGTLDPSQIADRRPLQEALKTLGSVTAKDISG